MTEPAVIETHAARPIDCASLQDIFRHVGWCSNRDAKAAQLLLAGPSLSIGAWSGDRLVGYGRALSDGLFRALIEDVIVDPRYRRRGIGSKVMVKLLNELGGVEEVQLACDEEAVPFYRSFGFLVSNHRRMYRRNG